MERRRRILIAPLDWGLGHATRCIPVIRALLKRNAEVIIAASGSSARLLKDEFPDLKHYPLQGYAPRYATGLADNSMVWAMGRQLPYFIKTIYREYDQVNALVKKENIDIIISDNRYGCYSPEITSVFITHQPHVLMPPAFKWMEPPVNYFNRRQMSRFNACWIPAPDAGLLGAMIPADLPKNTRFIGHLSRFKKLNEEIKYEVVVVTSGPDPQREMLANMLRQQLQELNIKAFLVCGEVDGPVKIIESGNITEANYLGSEQLNQVIQQGRIIIARSGYSTMMDLARLGKKSIFIPTPGQTEQALLAAQLMQQGIAFSMPQSVFNMATAIKETNKFSGFTNFATDESLLEQAIQSIL